MVADIEKFFADRESSWDDPKWGQPKSVGLQHDFGPQPHEHIPYPIHLLAPDEKEAKPPSRVPREDISG